MIGFSISVLSHTLLLERLVSEELVNERLLAMSVSHVLLVVSDFRFTEKQSCFAGVGWLPVTLAAVHTDAKL